MAVQSEIFSTEYGVRSFISTKHIATKQHMAVWLQRVSDDVWIQLSQSNYELINNSAVLTTAPNSATYSKVEIRVADTPDELTPSPSEISIIANNIGSINIVAENITDINDVSDSIENVNIIASYTDNIDINANNIDDINVTAEAIRGGGTVYDTIKLSYSIDTVDDFTSVPKVYTTAIVKDPDRGGIFHWSATGTANGGTVFVGATGFWHRQYSGAINVKWFGAKGDYSFSTLLGTDDSTTINNMFTYVNDIYFPPGNYLIENTINVPSNVVLFGDAQRKVTFIAKGCDAFKVYGNDTTIRDIKVDMDDGYWAFTYRDVSGALAAGLTSTNCQNLNNQVYGGNAFNLEGFSRGLISGFIGNNLDKGVRITGYSHNSMISDSIFNGHNNPTLNTDGEYAFKADSSATYMNVEGLSVTNSKFISFYDGVINEGMRYSTFSNIIFDVITYQGYRNTGFNKNITFSDCYFACNWEDSRGAFPTAYGYKAFILFIPLSSEEANLAQEFKGCYFVTYKTAPDVIANIDLYNGGITFTLCHDIMSGSNYSICLVESNKNCIITNNKQFKSIVSNATYSATPEFKFDTSNRLDTLVNTTYKNLSTWKELLYNSYTTTTASGILKSNIMQVTIADGSIPKVFKVYIREGGPGLSFISTKEYLVTMSYSADASVNNGIQLVATSALWNGSINRVTPTLTSTGANTDKQLTFVWSSATVVEIIIERIA